MALLICALVCALLSSACAGPAKLLLHHKAHIRDSDSDSDQDSDQDRMNMWRFYTATRSSSESQSSEESSEDKRLTQAPPTELPPAGSTPPTGLPVTMTTGLPGTHLPTMVTGCVTVDISTEPPVTIRRGDA
ncbi:hypothetical protein NL108_011592 [Boleophthalmus pectinirostris]|nr:hypothetical protein NL108_011592 [Boleophthalmus pectinirostris]